MINILSFRPSPSGFRDDCHNRKKQYRYGDTCYSYLRFSRRIHALSVDSTHSAETLRALQLYSLIFWLSRLSVPPVDGYVFIYHTPRFPKPQEEKDPWRFCQGSPHLSLCLIPGELSRKRYLIVPSLSGPPISIASQTTCNWSPETKVITVSR